MTAYGDVDTAVAALRAGAYDFIQKPFKLHEIKDQVSSALRATQFQEPPIGTSPSATTARVAAVAGDGGHYFEMIRNCLKISRTLDNILERYVQPSNGKAPSGRGTPPSSTRSPARFQSLTRLSCRSVGAGCSVGWSRGCIATAGRTFPCSPSRRRGPSRWPPHSPWASRSPCPRSRTATR